MFVSQANGVPTVGQLIESDPNLPPTGQSEASRLELESMVMERFKSEEPASRRSYLVTRYWKNLGMRAKAIESALKMMTKDDDSLMRTELLAVAYWNNQERGQAADLLNRLQGKVDERLYQLALYQTRFWQQQKLGEGRRLLRKPPSRNHSIWR